MARRGWMLWVWFRVSSCSFGVQRDRISFPRKPIPFCQVFGLQAVWPPSRVQQWKTCANLLQFTCRLSARSELSKHPLFVCYLYLFLTRTTILFSNVSSAAKELVSQIGTLFVSGGEDRKRRLHAAAAKLEVRAINGGFVTYHSKSKPFVVQIDVLWVMQYFMCA